ncbi:hypothetical protein F0562_018700 [Nyssa sinensis]|uniref:Uncharacterized protein n=1 Tax=Nyssa sinensis TaxID=561372 RepID=A0A5J4ZCP3_9ASTE|nr:hypothetical protein F0562_018700 [Nyssa sinensis]
MFRLLFPSSSTWLLCHISPPNDLNLFQKCRYFIFLNRFNKNDDFLFHLCYPQGQNKMLKWPLSSQDLSLSSLPWCSLRETAENNWDTCYPRVLFGPVAFSPAASALDENSRKGWKLLTLFVILLTFEQCLKLKFSAGA